MSDIPTMYDSGAAYRRELMEQYAPGNIPASMMQRHKAVVAQALMGNATEMTAGMGFSPRVAAWHTYDIEKRMGETKLIQNVEEVKALLAIEPVNAVLQALVVRKQQIDPDTK